MKLKRIMAIVLCFAMVLSTMSFNVFAETNYLTAADVFPEADADGVITLVEDITLPEDTRFSEELKIDLNGHTLKLTTSVTFNGNATLYNGTIDANDVSCSDGIIRADYHHSGEPAITLKLEDVTVEANNVKYGTGLFYVEDENDTLILTDVDVETSGANEGPGSGVFYSASSFSRGKVILEEGTTVTSDKSKAIFFATDVELDGASIECSNVSRPVFRQAAGTVTDSTINVNSISDGQALVADEAGNNFGVVNFVNSTVTAPAGTPAVNFSNEGSAAKADSTSSVGDNEGVLKDDDTPAETIVAKVGDEEFTDLQEAIEAVCGGETITLLRDVTITTKAYGDNALNHTRAVSFTLDLNEKTISSDVGNSVLRFNLTNSGATSDVVVNIKNGKIVSGANTWCTVMASGIEGAKAVLKLEDMTIENNKGGDFAVKAWSDGVVNANNVTINASYGGGFYALGGEVVLDDCTVNQKGLWTAPYLSMTIGVSDGGEMTVNSGTYSVSPIAASDGNNQGTTHGSWCGGVMSSGGTLIINDGTFSNGNIGGVASYPRELFIIGADADYGDNVAASLVINGGTFSSIGALTHCETIWGSETDSSNTYMPTMGVTITGGDFSGVSGKTIGGCDPISTGNPVDIEISGGTYGTNNSIDNSYLKEGFELVENENGTCGVVPAEEYVAQIGNTKYATLQAAIEAAQNGDTIVIRNDFVLDTNVTVANGKKITLDLNGKTITGADNNTAGNFYLFDNRGDLTITGEGKITLTATTNREWNASSVVVANNPGGKLTVNGGTLEHLGGTDMAYAVDNLTNGKGTYAETIINGGTIKSTYRAIRQFLNGIEAQNILTVNGGTVEGANKSIWMQDPSKNANTGKLTVTEDATLNGDVYLTVTKDSTEWPVEVSIAKSAVNGQVLTNGNEPAGYAIAKNADGTYGVVEIPELPTATVTEIPESELDENTPLTFALNFKADEVTDAQLDYYDNWYADFALTVNKDVTFNADGSADGYLAGQYDAWSENWLSVPFEDVTLEANTSLKIMEYAAELLGQSGLKLTYNDVYTFVKDFDCGVYFTPEFIAANPDLEVTLELRMYNPEDESESYVIGETYEFEAPAEEETLFSIAGTSMTLGNDLSMNFYFEKANIAGEDYYVVITKTYADKEDVIVNIPYSEWIDNDASFWKVSFDGIAAKEMCDEIHIQVFSNDGTAVSEKATESIRNYSMRRLANTATSTEEKITLVDMLNYGAAAQIEFNYNTEDLADAKLTEEQKGLATDEVECAIITETVNEKAAGSTLVLVNNIVLRMWFKDIDTSMSAVISYTDHYGNKKEYRVEGTEFVESNGFYGVDVDTLVVADGYQPVSCTIYNSQGEAVTGVTESVSSYVARAMNNGSAQYEPIIKFIASAKKFLHK